MIAIGTGGDHRLHAGIGPGLDHVLGGTGKIGAVSHVKCPTAATGLGFPHDAEIDAGFLKNVYRSAGGLSEVPIVRISTACMEDDFSLLL